MPGRKEEVRLVVEKVEIDNDALKPMQEYLSNA